MRTLPRGLPTVVVGMTFLLAACVGPAPSAGSYEGKAGVTAEDMRSVVETARSGVALTMSHKAFAPYVSEVLHYAEDDVSSIQGAFDSIQPPDDRSDQLRTTLDDLLSSAVSTLSDLRIAARRGDFAKVAQLAGPLPKLSRELERFTEHHPPGGPP